MTNFVLGICYLCGDFMTLKEIREGVDWEERDNYFGYYSMFWEPEEDCRIAHRRCWKDLEEEERQDIRDSSGRAPRSLGQFV